ncbi:cytochrome o ubiquinol oxidase subunit I [Pseudomonas nicosulfuronedens]
MFGKLTLAAVPYQQPIIMWTLVGMLLIGAAILVAITYYRKWTYLWTEWLTSVDHKKIGVMYIVVALVMLVRGLADALMMRTQLAMAEGANHGYLPPEHYDQIFTAHGVIMIIFMAMPFMAGLMNLVIPLQIGARDVAFPFLNSLSFWLMVSGMLLVMASLVVGEFARTGWVAYPPLSEMAYSPDQGVDYYIWALQIAGMGTILTAVNFLVTIFKMRAPGMKPMQIPIFTWTCAFSSILILASFPMLTASLGLLSLDRYLDMHFFTNELGGNAMMYVNLFWAWGHPEVYILVLPAFGIFSEVTATFAGKRMFGYTSMVWASGAITFLGFTVWLHHFFTMGSGGDVNAFFGIATMLIAIPTGVKLFNWLFTLYRGRIRFSTPIHWTLGFMVTFSIGGMTGVLLAIPGADFLLHNSLFLVAHFHNTIIGGVVFGYLAGFAYWFPKVFGFKLDEKWGKRSFWCWFIGFYVAFMPLYVLGFMGMTRRLNHYENPDWQPYLIVAFFGILIILGGVASLVIQLVLSIRNRERLADVSGDPWDGRTLEWATASPAPFYNFAELPQVRAADAFHDMKQSGTAYRRPALYQPIHMPKNTAAGVVIGLFSFVGGFALIWQIWWLALVGLLGMIGAFVVRSYETDVDYYVQPDEIERIESARFQKLATQQA